MKENGVLYFDIVNVKDVELWRVGVVYREGFADMQKSELKLCAYLWYYWSIYTRWLTYLYIGISVKKIMLSILKVCFFKSIVSTITN